MDSRIEKTIELHNKGYNCAQSVACTYCDLVNVDEKTMFRLTEGLGLGMGCMEGTCGALTGACILAGLSESTGNLDAPDSKAATYKVSKQILTAFKQQNKAVTCKELKGVGTGIVLRSCPDCIRDAARLAEEIVFDRITFSEIPF